MRAEYQRWASESAALVRASATAPVASAVTSPRFWSGTAVSSSDFSSSGGIAVTTAAAITASRKPMSRPR